MRVELRDKGLTLNFPDTMTEDEVRSVIRRKFYNDPSPMEREPIPFDFDSIIDGGSPEISASQTKFDIGESVWGMVRPYVGMGYTAASAFNRGMADLTAGMDHVAKFIEKQTGMKSEGIFGKAADAYMANSDWWRSRADKIGIGFVEELVGEAMGGAVPGIGEFLLNVPWAAIRGAAEAENPLVGALVEGGKRGVLGVMFKALEPFRLYLRMPAMAGTFGVDAWAEGGEARDIAKAVGTGAIYAASSPGGRMGLNDLRAKFERVGRPEEMELPGTPPDRLVKPNYSAAERKGMRTTTAGEFYEEFKGKYYFHVVPTSGRTEKILKEGVKKSTLGKRAPKWGETTGDGVYVWLDPYAYGIETFITDDLYKSKAYVVVVDRKGLRKPLVDEDSVLRGGVGDTSREINTDFEMRFPEESKVLESRLAGIKEPVSYKKIVEVVDKFSAEFGITADTMADMQYHQGGRGPSGRIPMDVIPPDKIKAIYLAEVKEGTEGEWLEVYRRAPTKPEPEWKLAIKTDKGTVITGKKGEIHADLIEKVPKGEEAFATGWVDEKGDFYLTKDKERVDDYVMGAGETTRPSESRQEVGDRRDDLEGKTRRRKFLRTIRESDATVEGLREKIKEIDPQEYRVHPDPETEALVRDRINLDFDEAVNWVKDESAAMTDEKGFTGIRLAEILQGQGKFDEAASIIDSLDRQYRQAGRFIRSASMWSALTPAGFLRWAEKVVEATNRRRGWMDTLFRRKRAILTKDDKIYIQARMTEIQKMEDGIDRSDSTLQLIDFVASKAPPSVNELIDAYRYQNMLSGVRTQMRNIGENIFNTFVTRPYLVATRAGVDWFQAKFQGKERANYIREIPLYVKTALNAVPNANNAFIEAWKMSKFEGPLKPDLGIEISTQFEAARAKRLPKPLTIVQRFMEGMDRWNSAMIAAGEEVLLLQKGMAPELAARQAQALAQKYLYRSGLDATDPSLSYMSQALAGLGRIMDATRRLPTLGPISKWVVPFLRTPLNKGIAMVEMSPLGAFRPMKSWDMEVAAKVLGGSIVTAIGAMMAMNGDTTWTPPSGEKEKQWFYASGRKAFSVRIGRTWVPFWYLGPFAMAFGIPAAVKHYAEDEKTTMTKEAHEIIIQVAMGLARFLGSQTSAQSIGNLFAYLSGDIDFTAVSQFAFTLGQTIPAQSMIRQIANLVDPIYRKPADFWEMIKKDVPFMSRGLAPRRDPVHMPSERDTINSFVPYDLGFEKPQFEGLYPSIQIETKINYLSGKLNDVMDKVAKGEMKPDKANHLYAEYLQAFEEVGP